jgi:hypothetical protein
LTKERIEQLLEERGHKIAQRTNYRRLESLSKDGILKRTLLPKTTISTRRGRPAVIYKLDEDNNQKAQTSRSPAGSDELRSSNSRPPKVMHTFKEHLVFQTERSRLYDVKPKRKILKEIGSSTCS